ncbi:MAG: hypothetical protein ACI4MQ_07935 [Candidatus Coproplasma sp.]
MGTIKSGNLEITATELGAEIISVKHNGKERSWQNDNGSWSRHAPVLFPVCGICEVRVNGIVYDCSKHGFAIKSKFTVVEQTENSLKYRLVSSARSKDIFPYAFILEVGYEIEGNELKITYEVYNPQDRQLYFSCGGHDSFALDKGLENYELQFEKDEVFESKLVDVKGYLTGKSRLLGSGKTLDLTTDLLEKENSICLDKLNSRSVTLREKSTGKEVVKVSFPDSEKLVLWHPDGSKMLCIEPWQNLPDTKDENREFSQKDGVIKVAPFGRKVITRTVRYY